MGKMYNYPNNKNSDDANFSIFEMELVNTELASGKVVNVCFLTIQDVAELTGMCLPKVQELFRRADFPSFDMGKSKVVEIHAFVKFFMERHSKDEFKYKFG